MKEMVLFEGELFDKTIEPCVMELIGVARQRNEDVFLCWNGETLRITPKSTYDCVLQDYHKKCRATALLTKEINGEIFSVEQFASKLSVLIRKFLQND